MNRLEKTNHPGIYKVHMRTCDRTACKCPKKFQGVVSVLEGGKRKLVRRHFAQVTDAKQWRQDAAVQVRAKTFTVPKRTTLKEAADDLIAGMTSGKVKNRSKKAFKPSTIRGYETHLRTYILPAFGHRKLTSIDITELQEFADGLEANPHNLSPSTVRNVLCPLQVIFRLAVRGKVVSVNPTVGLDVSTEQNERDRVASPGEAAELLAALPDTDRAIWAAAFYAGLRRGELQALRWRNVDFGKGVIRVEKSWDQVAGELDPKSKAGTRRVPMADPLRRELRSRKLATGGGDDDLVFGRTSALPFVVSSVRIRALKAWGWRVPTATEQIPVGVREWRPKEDGTRWIATRDDALEPIGLHEARHTAASYMIAAGINAKELSVFMGHSSIQITYDRYGHLLEGGHERAAEKLSAFLASAEASG